MISENPKSWETAEWSREKPQRFWDPGRQLLKSIRHYQKIKSSKCILKKIKRKICALQYHFWSTVSGAEIDINCKIGGGLLIPHPNGIIIHPDAEIGVNCLIFQQVTLAGPVKLGYHVDIGAGAKLLAPLNVGNDVRIGANSVVTKDIKSGLTVVGIPAKPID